MKKIIEVELLEKVLNYLSKMGWGEVNDLIVPLTQLENFKEEVKEKKEEVKEKDAGKTTNR